ncbi:hypothetical protein JCM8547_006592 [Rhodosporidiobolus lusitaniae]
MNSSSSKAKKAPQLKSKNKKSKKKVATKKAAPSGPPKSNPRCLLERSHIGGKPIQTFGAGTADGFYWPERNWLAITSEMNLCSVDGRPERATDPIVFSHKDKCGDLVDVISEDVHEDKHGEGVQVFIQRSTSDWLYRGKYVLAFDGREDENAQPLPQGRNELDRIGHPLLKGVLYGHLNNTRHQWPEVALESWNFEARTKVAAEAELKEGTGGGRGA